jgi:predicted small secreted protein
VKDFLAHSVCKRHTGTKEAGTSIATRWGRYPNIIERRDLMFRTLMAALLIAFFAAGCNTMAGAGKDIERGGEKIQGAAERNK